jgi:predicted dinucleotide-binding enzyme
MKIAILGGTGSIGKGLALRCSIKHEIVVCSRELDKAIKAAGEYSTLLSDKGLLCCGISGCTNETGIKDVDVVVLSVPYQGIVPLPKSVKVVSAYHNVPARKLANLEIALDYDVAVCGDNDGVKGTVMELTRDINNKEKY